MRRSASSLSCFKVPHHHETVGIRWQIRIELAQVIEFGLLRGGDLLYSVTCQERGLTPKSIVRHQPFIRRFLHEVCPAGVGALGRISQEDVIPTSSATFGIGARNPGRRCAGRCVHFSDTSIMGG
jgi:hypothetical protein